MRKNQLLVTLLLLLTGYCYGQQPIASITPIISKAIEKAYPASVRIWGYDTTSRQQMSAQFSGVVVSEDGYILTVAHTTLPGKTYKVTFPDGKEAIAIGTGKINFPETPILPDVATMQIITPGKWPFAEMGRSASVKVDEPCISIAYPESLNQPFPVVRFGRITHVLNDKGFIQSSCIMEPGDSGGPLFDYLGRVIGLHSAIDPSEAINYEVPVDLYQQYRTQLAKPVHYTKFPDTVDVLPADKYAGSIMTLPGLRDQLAKLKTNNKAIVRISSELNGHLQQIEGTQFDVDGKLVVVSKNSCVGEKPQVIMRGKQQQAIIAARDKTTDLVLLVLPKGTRGDGLKLSAQPSVPDSLGRFLFSPQPDSLPVVSVLGSHQFISPKMNSLGFLGAAIDPSRSPLALTFVMPGSPAAAKGLEVGDQVISINGTPVIQAADYGRELTKYWPGDTVLFRYGHHGDTLQTDLVLGVRPEQPSEHPALMFKGGRSVRRDGFEAVYAHDAILRPEQCGGPVFDSNGHFYGINIARFSRTTTLFIPATVIAQFINTHLPSARH